MRIVDDQFKSLIEALTTIKTEVALNEAKITAIANQLDNKAPKDGAIAIVGTIDGVPATIDGAYVTHSV